MKGKKELYDSLSINNGIAFVAYGHARLREMADGLPPVVWYGTDASCDIRGELLETASHLVISWRKKPATKHGPAGIARNRMANRQVSGGQASGRDGFRRKGTENRQTNN